jgi:hypothetical protein
LARYWLFTFVWFVVACSGGDERPLVVKNPDRGGTGGSAGEGGEGPRGGTTTNGGSGGTAATGGTGNVGGFANPDPDEIYVLGTLELGNTTVSALFHWASRDDYAAGFDSQVSVFKAKVGESGLLYQIGPNGTEIRRFVPDLTSSEPLESISYPDDPTQNDPVVAELECADGGFVLHFVVGPGDRIVYFCSSGAWFQGGEVIYDGGESMLALGYGDLAVMTDDSTGVHYVVNLASDERTQIEDIGHIYAVRAIRGGFLVAGIGENGDELWEVGEDAQATSRGLYTPQEPGIFQYFWALEPDGTLYELDQVGRPETIMTRRRVGGSNEIVFNDSEPGNVYLGGHGLATGP